MTKFYTSDLHFDHKNIIRYSNRPFGSVEEMNQALIANINATVGIDDELYMLGDIAFSKRARAETLMGQIVCQNLFLVPGNHDSEDTLGLSCWKEVSPLMEIYDNGQKVVLCHFSLRVWNKSHRGALQLYGHSHGSLPGTDQSQDVGVDVWDYKPVTLKEIRRKMAKNTPYRHEDHHRPEMTTENHE